jgi:hypothetical protein
MSSACEWPYRLNEARGATLDSILTLVSFGDNIVTTDGDVWKRHRACATSAFSESNNRLVHLTTISTVGEAQPLEANAQDSSFFSLAGPIHDVGLGHQGRP